MNFSASKRHLALAITSLAMLAAAGGAQHGGCGKG